ncbi:MAG: outer membrane lipoprotein carrier protein LolA [Aliiglaciecola sp.]|uniref:LolA family protein n=1 Tax=Aliiglaciecola sp. TaxID=1872441 RepID=UPI003298FA30
MKNVSLIRLFFFCLTLLPSLVFAQFDINELNAISSSPEFLQGQFVQQKYLNDFDVSLESTGKFDYLQGQNVHWHTLTPIQNLVTMTPSSIVSSQGEVEVMSLQAESNPVVTLLSEVFFSVLTSQWQQLESYFVISGEVEAQTWSVLLEPKDAALAQAISHVELKGDAYLRYLKFYESNGDYTEIHFSQLSQQK